MWSIALIIHTSTWHEFKNNWRLLCLVFLQLHQGEECVNQEHRDTLVDKIRKIKSDTITVDAIKSTDCVQMKHGKDSSSLHPYEFSDNDNDDGDDDDEAVDFHKFSSRRRRKKVRKRNEQQDECLMKTRTYCFEENDCLKMFSEMTKQIPMINWLVLFL